MNQLLGSLRSRAARPTRCRSAGRALRCCNHRPRHRPPPALHVAGWGRAAAALAGRDRRASDWWGAHVERRCLSSSAGQDNGAPKGHGSGWREHMSALAVPTLVPDAAAGCKLHLALQLLHVGTTQPAAIADTTSAPSSDHLAAHVEQLVLDAIAAGDATDDTPRDVRWRERLYELWRLPSAQLQEMLALRGLDYELAEPQSGPDVPVVDSSHEGDEMLTDSSSSGHATLVYRMLEYEQELATFDDDEDEDEFDDNMFRTAGGDTGGTWQLSSGGGSDAAALADFEALVGVVRGQLAVPAKLSEAVRLLQEEQLSDILVIDLAAASAAAEENGGKPVPAIGSHMVIASGQSTKHIYTAAQKLAGLLNAHGLKVLGTSISVEGDRDDDWLVVDGGAFIFSLFLPNARVEYDLEGLWASGGESSGESSGMWHIDDIDKDDDDDIDKDDDDDDGDDDDDDETDDDDDIGEDWEDADDLLFDDPRRK